MPSVCMYFQVHQPYRLRRLRAFDAAGPMDLFDDRANAAVMRKVADKCYIPTNTLLTELIERHWPRFRIAMSITGVAVEQMEAWAPDALESFQRLVATGGVSLLAETYHHSLAAVFSPREFRAQVRMHQAMCRRVFGLEPTVFRNTELIYDDRIGRLIADAGFHGVLAEGCDDILGWRTPNLVYSHPESRLPLLLKNYRLSDDIAFRFSDRSWPGYPLTADRFAHWIHSHQGPTDVVNLFMDYETFGEHQWADSGIFRFLDGLPAAILANPAWDFATPSEAIQRYEPAAALSFARTTSWADAERDLSAWTGNLIQQAAARRLYELEPRALATGDPEVITAWRRLLTSDHLYYMSTKCAQDGDVHAYFSPYDGPYDAFIALQNAAHHLERAVAERTPATLPQPVLASMEYAS